MSSKNIKPYRFEPMAPENNPGAPSENPEPENKAGHTNWCKCGKCVAMTTDIESVCCQEYYKIQDFMKSVQEEDPTVQCLTQHPGFKDCCLSPWVLLTAWHDYNLKDKRDVPSELHGKYRYTAYRQVVRMCWGMVGHKIRFPLPSCSVDEIRRAYPTEPGQRYAGFKWPPLN